MKLISCIKNISNINTDVFHAHIKGDAILYYKYKQQSPYLLEIRADYEKSELVLEFTGKILLDKYPDLINKGNIQDCLLQINRLNICTLDIEAILNDAIVAKCDITKDIATNQLNDIITTVRLNIKNYKKWNISEYQANEGIVLNKVCKTPKYKKRLSIYDKARELRKSENKAFLDLVATSDEIVEYFKGKVRFELNVNTMEQIRTLLNIPNNNLSNVLASTANPILSVIDEAIKYESLPVCKMSLRDYERTLLIQKCNNDIMEVEATIRGLIGKNTSITRQMQPYRDLILKASTAKAINLRELVA